MLILVTLSMVLTFAEILLFSYHSSVINFLSTVFFKILDFLK